MTSGEAVFLAGDQGDRLVGAVAMLAATMTVPFAIIGGIAVSVRAGPYRATSDVDAVVNENDVQLAVSDLAGEAGGSRVFVDGTNVDLLGVGVVGPGDTDGLNDHQALFVLAHEWALTTASPAGISCRAIAEPVVAPFASPFALIAMKLPAFEDRSASSATNKRASDAADIYHLLLDCPGEIASGLADATAALRHALTAAATRVLLTNADATARLARSADRNIGDLRGETLAALAQPLLGLH
ncbi:MAG: hypothetical protein H0U92_12990 [Actinobacteria bacterium]|nr:hypothetical protein [Actinomycetota bacterium]